MSLIQRALDKTTKSDETKPVASQRLKKKLAQEVEEIKSTKEVRGVAPVSSHEEISLGTFLDKPTESLPPKLEPSKDKQVKDSTTRQWVVAALIFLGLVMVAVVFWSGPESKHPVSSENVLEVASAASAKVGRKVESSFLSAALSRAASLPPKTLSSNTYVLSGISDQGDKQYAVINDDIFSVGDAVNAEGVTVAQIQEKIVILKKGTDQIILEL